jgi:hypothetical protein
MKNPSYSPFELTKTELLFNDSDNTNPTKLYGYVESMPLSLSSEGDTFFVFNQSGETLIKTDEGEFTLKPEMYASIPNRVEVIGGNGIVIQSIKYNGFFHIGGKLERKGRLKYIDGCTDSLLIPPVMKGNPCFNLLYFPKGISQTQHTHPDKRVGMIVSGKGKCITPWGKIDLVPGQVFIIHEEGKKEQHGGIFAMTGTHSFETNNEEMRVVAFHPTSDFGPVDEEHPMINRTIVNGVSAKNLKDIRTV